MICPICGTKNKEEEVRCTKCGLILVPGKVRRKREEEEKSGQKKKVSAFSVRASLSKGRYQIEKKLGSGGMSRVLLARDKKMDCYVVVKELLPYFEFSDMKEADYLEKRFMQEAKLLYRLDHKGLPKVMDYFAEGERLYFIMQFIDGETLANIVFNRPAKIIELEEGLKWMKDIIDILIYLHNQEPPVIHRDIKPHNIMLDKKGKIYLVDFGIAREVKGSAQTGTSVGTFGYASPEHFTGKFLISSDMYSLGATFHMLMSGEDPRERPPFKFTPLSNYRNDIPDRLEEIFSRMLQMDPKKRFQTAKALKVDLLSFIDEYYGKDASGSSDLELKKVDRPKIRKKKRIEKKASEEMTTDLAAEETGELEKSKPETKVLEEAKLEKNKKKSRLFAPRSRVLRKKDEEAADKEEAKAAKEARAVMVGKQKVFRRPRKISIIAVLFGSIVGLAVLLGIAYFLFVHILKMPLPIPMAKKSIYSLKASSSSEKVIYEMKKAIGDQYKFKTDKKKSYKKRKNGYRAVQKFNNIKSAKKLAVYLGKKGIPAKVVKDPEMGILLQVGGIYSNKNEARRIASRAQRIVKTSFEVTENYIWTQYTTYVLIVSGIPGKKKARDLEASLSEFKAQRILIKKVGER